MNQEPESPFDRAIRVIPAENQKFSAAISEQFVLNLKAEFAKEDIIFAETILPEYFLNLQQEDYA